MKIANADKLKEHFENVVDVKLFTPAQILTIIDTFSVEVGEGEWLPTTRKNIFDEQTSCFECSICHKAHIPLMNVLIHEKIPICPNCGSHMIGGA